MRMRGALGWDKCWCKYWRQEGQNLELNHLNNMQ